MDMTCLVVAMAMWVSVWSVSVDHSSASISISHSGMQLFDSRRQNDHDKNTPLMRRGFDVDTQGPAAVVADESSERERAAIQARSKVGSLNWTRISEASAKNEGMLNMTNRGFQGRKSLGNSIGYWKDASTYYRHNISECKDLCLRNSDCEGFVDHFDSYPHENSCIFRAEASLDAMIGSNYNWYSLLISWTKHAFKDVIGSDAYDVFDWVHTPDCTDVTGPECNVICKQTPQTNIQTMCNVWAADRSKFYFDRDDEHSSLLHCESYCRDAPACLGFVDVWATPKPYCQLKTSVHFVSVGCTPFAADCTRRDFWQML